ncbi:MAG: class I SAM-dependent methyltransferase [Actinobacteria bacterium]|nr:class I SAM-dependent methyltransferase [Actinomycetota bacterium]
MFTKSAAFYDAIYSFKDYAAEAIEVRDLIRKRNPAARTLLDVACGTGRHLQHLADAFEVEGVDLDEDLLEIARRRLPDVPLHHGDMRSFDLGRTFDAVTCLFSSVGYVRSEEELGTAVARMVDHLNPGGVVVVEGWIGPEEWNLDHIGSLYVDEPGLKIARMNVPQVRGRMSIVDFHYLVGTQEGISHFTELHELYLFTPEEYTAAIEATGVTVERDAEALMGRGVYIGVKD